MELNAYLYSIETIKKIGIMKKLQFLKDNKEQVVKYYNSKIKGLYDVTLKDFMTDLLDNFRKITTDKELVKFDLFGNLKDAESRLGCKDVEIGVSYSKPYSESNHAKAVAYHGKDKVELMSNAQ